MYQDSNGRTIWYSGEAGPLAPKVKKVIGRKGWKSEKRVPVSGETEAADKKVKAEPGTKPKAGGRVQNLKAKKKSEKDLEAKDTKVKVKREKVQKEDKIKVEKDASDQTESVPKRKLSVSVKGKPKKELKKIKLETEISNGVQEEKGSVLPVRRSRRSVSSDKSYTEYF